MADAKRDGNRITTLLGVSSADGTTPTLVYVDPVTGAVLTSSTAGSTGKTLKTATGTISSSGSNTIISAVSSKRLKIFAYSLATASTTAVTCTFKSNTGGTALWTVGPLQAISGTSFGANLSTCVPGFLFATTAGHLLDLTLSAAQSVTYSVSYWDDDAS